MKNCIRKKIRIMKLNFHSKNRLKDELVFGKILKSFCQL